jgi:hypothetical protein
MEKKMEEWLEAFSKSKTLRKWAVEHGVPTVEISVVEGEAGDIAMPLYAELKKGE